MEKVIISLCLFLFPVLSFAQGKSQPSDIINTELLINLHKKQQDGLKKRVAQGIVVKKTTETVKKTTNTFEELHNELTSRYSLLSAWTSTGLTMFQLATEVKDVLPLVYKFGQRTKYLTNIYIANEYLKTIESLEVEVKFLATSIKKIPLLKADAKSITELLFEIQYRVTKIKRVLSNCLFMVEGYIALQSMSYYKEDPIDKARIATSIIKRYSQK